MNFKSVSDFVLLEDTKRFALSEKQSGIEVLHRLREIDARKLFASLGFSSLFDYCTRELGYSEGSACRRIQTMRLLQEVPEYVTKLEDGLVNETQLGKVQSFLRRQKKKKKDYSKTDKLDLLKEVEGKSSKQTDQLLASKDPEAAREEKTRPLNGEEIEIRFTADQVLMEKLERVKNFLGNRSYADLIEELADLALKKLEPKSPPQVAVEELPTSETRYIPVKVKRAVWQRDGGKCTYITPDGKRCDSKHLLQFEHIIPFAQRGKTIYENLTLLCPAHNKFSAIQAYGLPKMQKYWAG